MMLQHLRRMALYNHWANGRLYDACKQLDEAAYHQSRKMFFGSIHGTLNHILVGDKLWLARIERQPAPILTLDDQPFADLASLRTERAREDARMIELTKSYGDDDLSMILRYRTVTQPADISTALHLCWLHLFNHQTHHRGQIHDQFSQIDVPPPSLDLIYYLREQA